MMYINLLYAATHVIAESSPTFMFVVNIHWVYFLTFWSCCICVWMCCREVHTQFAMTIHSWEGFVYWALGTKQLMKFEQNKYSMTGDVGLSVTIYYLFCSTVGSVGDIASNATTFRRRSFATRAPLIFVWQGSLNGGYRVSHRHDRKVHTLLDSPTTRPCSCMVKKYLYHIGILLFRVNFAYVGKDHNKPMIGRGRNQESCWESENLQTHWDEALNPYHESYDTMHITQELQQRGLDQNQNHGWWKALMMRYCMSRSLISIWTHP